MAEKKTTKTETTEVKTETKAPAKIKKGRGRVVSIENAGKRLHLTPEQRAELDFGKGDEE